MSESSSILRTRLRVCGRSPRRPISANLSRPSEPLLVRFKRDCMDPRFGFRFRAGLRQSQLPMRGRAELSMSLHVREQAFNVGRSSDRHRRISSTSSGGSRFHPLAHLAVGEVCRGLRCNLAGRSLSFFHNRYADSGIYSDQRSVKTKIGRRIMAGDSPKVGLTLIRECWRSFKESDCRGSPPLHGWHFGVQNLAGASSRGHAVGFPRVRFRVGSPPFFPAHCCWMLGRRHGGRAGVRGIYRVTY